MTASGDGIPDPAAGAQTPTSVVPSGGASGNGIVPQQQQQADPMVQAQPVMPGMAPGAGDPNQVTTKPRQTPGGSAGNPTMPGDGGSMFGDDASAEADDGNDSSDGGDTDQPSGFSSMGSMGALALRVEAAMDVVRGDMPGISDEEAYQIAREALMTHQAALEVEADWEPLSHTPNVRPHRINWADHAMKYGPKAVEVGKQIWDRMTAQPNRVLPPHAPKPGVEPGPEPVAEPEGEPEGPQDAKPDEQPGEPEDYQGRHRAPHDPLGDFLDEFGPRAASRWRPFDDPSGLSDFEDA